MQVKNQWQNRCFCYLRDIQDFLLWESRRVTSLYWKYLENYSKKFSILIRGSNRLGSTSETLINSIQKIWLCCHFKQRYCDLLFLQLRKYNAVVTRLMIMWSNMWSDTWSNTWPTHILFVKRINLILLLSDSSSSTYHPSNKTSIELILIASRRRHWLVTLVVRRGHHQLVDRRSETSMNISIILIDAIYKEFSKYWLSGTLIAKLYVKPMRAWSSLSLAYQLIIVPTPFRSSGWVREALGHRRGRE